MLDLAYRVGVISWATIVVMFLLWMLAVSFAVAQPSCQQASVQEIRDKLRNTFHEELRVVGVIGDVQGTEFKGFMELYSSAQSKTWTIIFVHPDGCARIVLGGTKPFQVDAILEPGQDS